MRLGRVVPTFLKPYIKPLYRRFIAAVSPMNSATLPDWIWSLETGQLVDTPEALKEMHPDAVYYQPTPYQVLPYLRTILHSKDVFFDLGSGMGRVVLYVAGACKIRKAVGVEFSSDLVQVARTNLSRLQFQRNISTPVELINADA